MPSVRADAFGSAAESAATQAPVVPFLPAAWHGSCGPWRTTRVEEVVDV